MPTYRTPGIYIKEISAFPPSVAEVETAIPVFIGYTQQAQQSLANDLILKPTKVRSMQEYEQLFGGAYVEPIGVSVITNSDGSFKVTDVTEPDLSYILYQSMRLFFANGGDACFIVSVGLHQTVAAIDLNGNNSSDPTVRYGLADGLTAVQSEDQPTLIVIPEAVKLTTTAEYQTLVQAVLTQCDRLKDRFGIFDIYHGHKASGLTSREWSINRSYFGNNFLKYGAVYYPFLKTSFNFDIAADETNINVAIDGDSAIDLLALKSSNSAVYYTVKARLRDHTIVLPPSPAVAGAYVTTDRNRGVWKAPANISLACVTEPVVKIDTGTQRTLNVDPVTGKSVNAIRSFAGRGTLIWGARTLAGNDNEWRYIPVRRFYNMVEESVKKSTSWAVFEPNNANTWIKVSAMIENYLTQKWRDGALMGSKPDEAFFVRCGLGSTMTSQDILQGRMNIEIGMAVIRPAEFIILKLTHTLQTP